MPLTRIIEQNIFRARMRIQPAVILRRFIYRRLGMQVGVKSTLGRVSVNWPHQIRIGRETAVLDGTTMDYCHGIWRPGPSIIIGDHCYIGRGVEFNCRARIALGNDCLVAAGCRFIDHDHGMAIGQLMRLQGGPEEEITVGDDVWLGSDVIVLKGVTIGDGAVIAAGAVVNRSVPAMEAWGGIPARRLRSRAQGFI